MADFDSSDPDIPKEARRVLRLKLRSPSSRCGPAWLADYATPLLLSIDGQVVRCRTLNVDADRWPAWIFEHDGRSSEGGAIRSDQTIDDVRTMAARWLRDHTESG